MRQKVILGLAATVLAALAAPACEGQVENAGGGGATSEGGSGGGVGASGGGTGSGGETGGGGTGSGGATGGGVCPGVTPWPQGTKTCHTSKECSGFEMCVPAPIEGCGICMAAQQTCVSDADCSAGVCETYTLTGPCVCPSQETGTMCVPHCSTAPCADGFACDAGGHCLPIACTGGFACGPDLVCDATSAFADAHGCAPAPCDAGFTCAPGDVCANGSPGADLHGCAPIHCTDGFLCPVNTDCSATTPGHGCALRSCSIDSDCDCGACVEGWCAPQIGICDSPPA